MIANDSIDLINVPHWIHSICWSGSPDKLLLTYEMKKDATIQDWIEAAFFCVAKKEVSRIEIIPYQSEQSEHDIV